MANLTKDDFYRRYGDENGQAVLDEDGIEDLLEDNLLITLSTHLERSQKFHLLFD